MRQPWPRPVHDPQQQRNWWHSHARNTDATHNTPRTAGTRATMQHPLDSTGVHAWMRHKVTPQQQQAPSNCRRRWQLQLQSSQSSDHNNRTVSLRPLHVPLHSARRPVECVQYAGVAADEHCVVSGHDRRGHQLQLRTGRPVKVHRRPWQPRTTSDRMPASTKPPRTVLYQITGRS